MILVAGILGLLYGFLIRKGNWQSLMHKRFRLLALLFISIILELALVTPYLEHWQIGRASWRERL